VIKTEPTWLRSTRCESSGCVEAAAVDGYVLLRDSKIEDGPVLTFSRAEWHAFIQGVRQGEF
jgi:hypothetical protein